MTEQNQRDTELTAAATSTPEAEESATADPAESSVEPSATSTEAGTQTGTDAGVDLDAPAPQAPSADPADAAEEAEPALEVPETTEPVESAEADQAQDAAPAAEDAPTEDAAPAAEEAQAASAQDDADPAAEDAPVQDAPVQDAPAAEADGQGGAPAAPAQAPVDPQEAMDAAKWGRVDGEGRVYVQDGGAEREVGQFPDAPVAEAMAFYVRRYLDLKATVDLFATRLPQLSVREIDSTLKSVEESLAEPAAVGDLEGLRARFNALKAVAAERRAAVAAERAAAKEQAFKERTAIVERAEAIAAQDPARTQWKSSGAELRELLETWKQAQRRGPRLDKASEDGLWKRFSHARTTFDRHRRQFFSELDAKQSKVKEAKEALIKRAEELQHSTDWAGTSAKYRDLMTEWKKAGRASRKEDDALWARFRAAQQVFFDARRAKDEAADAEFAENLKVKEALVAKAEALLPIKDVKAAKKALRPIQDAWDEAGRVPRSALRRIEGRMRAVEDAVREAENAEWRRSDPETKARAEGLAGQLEDAIASLEADLAKAQAAGDAKKIAEAEAALTARRAWLDQVRRSAKA
ncbi:DUF349 domain-containing protein [Actinomyces slackii]|uniref:Domain of Uncharacterized Function (DUF349) n=1 Tax=Actinomyces slackii TaxID=52774 RepID=A0A3S4WHX6_9ACTO|nr:DUF349 domain-containing protein [Actinomyces slackii]VEG75340.1 Domain of Uncharacterised Function (DUF349) [Actinomyces slackii]